MAYSLLKLVKHIKNKDKDVNFIRCDNTGENLCAKKVFEAENMRINFEFTARGTPQQNGVVERVFQTLYNRVRAMLNGGGFEDEMRQLLWVECANTATMLENMTVRKEGKSAFEKF